MSEWLPIETASKSRSAILVHCDDRHNTYVVTWNDSPHYPTGWYIFGAGNGFLYECPSHWMPLPTPPAKAVNP